MTGLIDTFFFLDNKTSWAGLLGSGLKIIFQRKAQLEIKEGSLLKVLALPVLSANSFGFVFTRASTMNMTEHQ